MPISDLVYVDATGYHYADYPTFLAYVQNGYKTIYGEDIVITPDSQDGQELAVQAQDLFDTAAIGAAIYNSFSPASAQGAGLARNVRINGIIKRVATKSTVDVDIVGTVGTTITDGIVEDTLNQKWLLPASVVIPIAGTITVTATAEIAGAVEAAINTVNKIFTPTRGWQTVNNAAAATAGVPVETDAELRARQALSVANPSLTVFDGTIGAVDNVDGVTDVRGYENDTGSTDSNGLPAHSIAIVVAGGDAMEIAQVIALHKTPGTRTDGTTTETVYDSHGMPLDIHFYRPTQVTIKVQITVKALAGFTSGYEDLIAAALAAYISVIGIGNDVLITKLYVPGNLPGTPAGLTFDITDLQIAKNSDPLGTANLDLAFNEIAVCDAVADVTVVVT